MACLLTSAGAAPTTKRWRRRAEHVAAALAKHGVDGNRLVVMSRGEADAIGRSNPVATMGYDRRVDILVMNPVTPGYPAELTLTP